MIDNLYQVCYNYMMSCPEATEFGKGCPVRDILYRERRNHETYLAEFYEVGGKLDTMLIEEQLARDRAQNPNLPHYIREQEQRHLAKLEADRLEQVEDIKAKEQPRYNMERLAAACIDGCSIQTVDTSEGDYGRGNFRVCGSLALNEDERLREVLPAPVQGDGPSAP